VPKTNTEIIQELVKTVAEQAATLAHIERATRLLQDTSEEHVDSTGEAIHQLRLELRVHAERDSRREREIAELRATIEREREERAKEREARSALERENAALKQQLQDHIKQVELWDSRRWGLFVLLVGTVLSLASGLIVTLAKK
jgi:hypothetical protein